MKTIAKYYVNFVLDYVGDRFSFIQKIKDIIWKIKDYDRLEHDYSRTLAYATDNHLSYTNYEMDVIESEISDTIQRYCDERENNVRAEFTEKWHKKIAEDMMLTILMDNGYVNRLEVTSSIIDKEWQEKIAPICGAFFDKNPEYLNTQHLENICTGEESENEELYGKLEGFKELDEILGEYFNDDCGIDLYDESF